MKKQISNRGIQLLSEMYREENTQKGQKYH